MSLRPRSLALAGIVLVVVVAVAAATLSGVSGPTRQQQEAAAPQAPTTNWTTSAIPGGCERGTTGGFDRTGATYYPCTVGATTQIVKVAHDGTSSTIPLTSGNPYMVAPSPDGRYLYSIRGAGFTRYELIDGSYVAGAMQVQFPHGFPEGSQLCGRGIATDWYGNVYVSSGSYCDDYGLFYRENEVLKFTQDGRFVTAFGEYAQGGAPNTFNINQGIAVTPDGSRIYVADEFNQRIQYFDRKVDGTYRSAGSWSGEGTSEANALGAVYAVRLDLDGNVYVTQTTPNVLWRLDPTLANPIRVATLAGAPADVHIHDLQVDSMGRIYVGEWKQLLTPSPQRTPAELPTIGPEPIVDRLNPVLTASLVDGATTSADHVLIGMTVEDDTGPAWMHFADENGDFGPWVAYESPASVPLTDGLGRKLVSVQVRDTVKRFSNIVDLRLERVAVPDTVDPTVTIDGPSSTIDRTVTLTITAHDNVGVNGIRIAGSDGDYDAWMPSTSGTSSIVHTLEPGTGPRSVTVQVKDAANRTAAARLDVLLQPVPVPAPDTTVPGGDDGDGTGVTPGGGDADHPGTGAARDTVKPRIHSLTVPASTCSRLVQVGLSVRDNRKVTHMRLSSGSGAYGPWRPFLGRLVYRLPPRVARTMVTVQVRDAAGNRSVPSSRSVRLRRCG